MTIDPVPPGRVAAGVRAPWAPSGGIIIGLLAILAAAGLGWVWWTRGPGLIPDFLAVALLGGLFGLGEIINRYHDEPWLALNSTPARSYLAVNGLASVLGLVLIHIYGWQFLPAAPAAPGAPQGAAGGNDLALRCTQVLLAGLGAMALFRSALFTIRVGGQDVGVGPIIFLQSILAAIDGSVDRDRGISRNKLVTSVMKDVSFARAYQVLPAHRLGLLQNVPPEAQTALKNEVQAIAQGNMEDDAKSLLLGLALINLVGETLLQDVVESLDGSIKVRPVEPAHPASVAPRVADEPTTRADDPGARPY